MRLGKQAMVPNGALRWGWSRTRHPPSQALEPARARTTGLRADEIKCGMSRIAAEERHGAFAIKSVAVSQRLVRTTQSRPLLSLDKAHWHLRPRCCSSSFCLGLMSTENVTEVHTAKRWFAEAATARSVIRQSFEGSPNDATKRAKTMCHRRPLWGRPYRPTLLPLASQRSSAYSA